MKIQEMRKGASVEVRRNGDCLGMKSKNPVTICLPVSGWCGIVTSRQGVFLRRIQLRATGSSGAVEHSISDLGRKHVVEVLGTQ